MKVILSHPTGNEFVRAAALGLLNCNMLAEFWTTVATFPGNVFDLASKLTAFSEFERRRYNKVLEPFTRVLPWFELGRLAASKASLNKIIQHETGILSVDAIYRQLDKKVAKSLKKIDNNRVDAIYAYEDGAFFSFQKAKELGMECFYDLPIGHWRAARRLMETERERWPDWESTLIGFGDSDEKLARKDEELQMADRIFVASTFTANTLKEYPGKLASIEVIPYGFPPVYKTRQYLNLHGKPLKLLFVGGLSQRKGIADLFAVAGALHKYVELTIVGQKAVDNCPVLNEALTKHRWIPSLAHTEILKLMRASDILVFPSLFEGFGLVITEAMSQGTPVITTERTAGSDLIKHGENGWLINAGSTGALQAAIENILIKSGSIAEAGNMAVDTASRRPWEMYGIELAQAVLNHKR